MRIFGPVLLVLALVAIGVNQRASSAASATAAPRTIVRISVERMAAYNRGDRATVARETSDSFQRIEDDGSIYGKARALPPAQPKYREVLTWANPPRVAFTAGVAMVTGTQSDVEYFPGGTVTTLYARTELYTLEHGAWVAIRSQVTPLPINHTRPVPAPPNIDQFVGKYRWANRQVDTITKRNGVLYSELNGPPPDRLLFSGPASVIFTNDLGVETFYRDARGTIGGYIERRCDGQTIRIPKIS